MTTYRERSSRRREPVRIKAKLMKNIVVLVSGGGTNLARLIQAQQQGEITGERITCVISSSPEAYALTRAAEAGIPSRVIDIKRYKGKRGEYCDALCAALDAEHADLVVYAGFMVILCGDILRKYDGKMINVHPSLLPAFGGEGFYGLKVHEAALARGVKISGATVHYVNAECDGGAIILQKAVAVKSTDTAEVLQKRIMEEAEQVILPQAVELLTRRKD